VETLTPEEEERLGELESEAETASAEAPTEVADFDDLEKDLQELGKAASAPGAEEDEDLTVADLDLDLDELTLEQPESPAQGAAPHAEVEVALSDGVPELDALEPASEQAGFGAATSPERLSSETILKKIEQDLKQIKQEIGNLKRELAGLGRPGAAEPEMPQAPSAQGFLGEEEDDSIALTGDELDNILNTADITEEKAAGTAVLEEALEEAPEELAEDSMEELAEAPMEELAEAPPEVPGAATAEQGEAALEDLLEPGSLTAEPEAVEIEFEEKSPAAEPEELLLEEPAAEAAPELGPEELTLEDFPEPGAQESLPEAGVEPEELAGLELPETELPETELGEVEPLEPAAEPAAEELEAEPAAAPVTAAGEEPVRAGLPPDLAEDMKSVLSYLDQLLEALPEDKIQQFAQSPHFKVYTKLFKELGLEG